MECLGGEIVAIVHAGYVDLVHGLIPTVDLVLVQEGLVAGERAVPAPIPVLIELERALCPRRAAPGRIAGWRLVCVELIDAGGIDTVAAIDEPVAPLGLPEQSLVRSDDRPEGEI